MKKPLFFDYSTSYHPFKEVSDILKKSIHPHSFSFQTKEMILNSEYEWQEIYRLFGAPKESSLIITSDFVSALDGVARDHYEQNIFHSGKGQVLILAQKPSLIECWERFKPFGVTTKELTTDSKGLLTPELLSKAITLRTSLVSISWAHPLTGVVQPVEALIKICKEKNIAFHLDLSDMIGKRYFSLKELGADYMTFDAKIFHGPCYMAGYFNLIQGQKQKTIWRGAPSYLQALKEALYQAGERVDDMHLEIARLKRVFEKKLLEKIPQLLFLFSDVERLPSVSVITFPKVSSEILLYFLIEDKIYPSDTLGGSSLSFSLSHLTTQEELEEAVERIALQYEKAKQFSSGLFEEGFNAGT